jgi:hypothetical protein
MTLERLFRLLRLLRCLVDVKSQTAWLEMQLVGV